MDLYFVRRFFQPSSALIMENHYAAFRRIKPGTFRQIRFNGENVFSLVDAGNLRF